MATIFQNNVSITIGNITMTAQQAQISIQVLHNPRSQTCQKRIWNEPWQEGEFCDVCDPPMYARYREPLPVCIYCWKPLVKFMPPAHYKGPDSEWTHFEKLTKETTQTHVICKSKQHGPRVPKMIPGRLIISEPELALENAVRVYQHSERSSDRTR